MNGATWIDPFWRFGIQAYVSFRGLFMWFTPFPYVSNAFVAPYAEIALFVLVSRYTTGAPPADAVVIGMSLLAASWIIYGGVLQSFTYEREFGTVAVLLASRGSRVVAYLSRGALHIVDGWVAATVVLVAAVLSFDVDWSRMQVSTVLLAVLAAAASCTALACAVGNLTFIFRNWFILFGGSQGSMLTLTGMVIPRSSLPGPLPYLGDVLPMTHALVALRAGFQGAPPQVVGAELLAELAVAVAYTAIGLGIYRWIEYRARVRGEFDD